MTTIKKNEKNIDEKPLITFALFAYNQEKFIREAVEGALSQTYEPLEIILSDDCSTDRTFEIMSEMVVNYKGPHKIIMNCNKNNLGVAAHVNKVVNLSQGEWLVFAAGDDISLKYRVAVLSRIINNKNIFGIGTAYQIIDKQGIVKDCQYQTNYILGCNAAWHRKCFDFFGGIPESLTSEDNVLYFRSLMLGSVAFSNVITVKYRMHDSISTNNYGNLKDYYKHLLKISNIHISTLNVRIKELNEYKMDIKKKSQVQNILESKVQNIQQNINIACFFLDLTKYSMLRKFDVLFFKNIQEKYSFKTKIKLLFLTNSFFAEIYTLYAPQWLKIQYTNKKIDNSNNEVIIKNMDNYIEDTDLKTAW